MGSTSNTTLILLVVSLLVIFAKSSITYDSKAIVINVQRRILISGSIHNPRSTPEVVTDVVLSAQSGEDLTPDLLITTSVEVRERKREKEEERKERERGRRRAAARAWFRRGQRLQLLSSKCWVESRICSMSLILMILPRLSDIICLSRIEMSIEGGLGSKRSNILQKFDVISI